MRMLRACAALSCAIFCSAIGAGSSSAVTINSVDNGWYQNSGFTAGVSNIYVGWNPNTGATYRNWLAFDLTGLAGQNVTSATLTFYGGNGVNASQDATETLGLFDYTGGINALISDQFNAGIYGDLGTGASYGTATVVRGPIQQFSVSLSAAAIAGLNATANNLTDRRFVVGGALLSINDSDDWYNNEALFVINGPQPALGQAAFLSLDVSPVPLPAVGAGLPGLAIAFGGILMWYRRRNAQA